MSALPLRVGRNTRATRSAWRKHRGATAPVYRGGQTMAKHEDAAPESGLLLGLVFFFGCAVIVALVVLAGPDAKALVEHVRHALEAR